MIDKLEVRLPREAQFTQAFGRFYQDAGRDPRLFRPSRLYLRVADLREYDYPMLLHLYSHHGKGNHKIELVETGGMSYAGMRHEIERVFAIDSRKAGVMRLDLAADVGGVPVSWFHDQVRVRFKQFACEIGQYSQMGREIQTLYFGKRPNCFRVYDKLAMWRMQYRKMLRGIPPNTEVPEFEELYGYPEHGATLTRVERQMGGGRVPSELESVGSLPQALHFDPFEPMEFQSPGVAVPEMVEYRVMTWLAGMQLRRMIEDGGLHQTRAWVNHRGRHWGRVAERLSDFFPPAPEGLTREMLVASYRDSLGRQLAA